MKKCTFIGLFTMLIISFTSMAAGRKINVRFNLNGQVFDYGQNIVSVELETSKLNVDPRSLSEDTFKVHAKGTAPVDTGNNKAHSIFDLTGETKAFGLFDVDREITKVSVNRKGNIVIDLKYGQGVEGANTLAYISGDVGRNVLLDLTYTIIQNKEFKLKNGTSVDISSVYRQGKVIDKEADAFISKTSPNKINYQYYAPKNTARTRKYPLIIWFHGNGEGGFKEYRNNVSQKLANRGVVAFGEKETQKIFGGAYVVAPQVDDTWYNNYSKDYIKKVKEMIDDITARIPNIDKNRIYVFGASAGGYMSIRMAIEYPDLFAGVNVSAPALDIAPSRGGVETKESEIAKLEGLPLWMVHAENDPTISYVKTSKYVYETLKNKENVHLSAYPNVKIGETEYNGHWSWIYSLRNMPENSRREKLFQWMAKQNLGKRK